MPKRRQSRDKLASGRARPLTSFDRRSGIRESRKAILIVCEGKATEPKYFAALKNEFKLPLVTIIGVGRAPITVVERAVELQEQRQRATQKARQRGTLHEPPFDAVWCVFDTEGQPGSSSFPRAVALARAHGFDLAISNPAFEYWYLLHFEETTRPFHNAVEVRHALEAHAPDYAKDLDFYPRLAPRMHEAIERAERVLGSHTAPETSFPNPSSSVSRLVRLLIGMRGRGR